MAVKSGELFEIVSRVSRRLWNIRRRVLINVPIFVQNCIKEERIDNWSRALREYSGELFARGVNVIPGKTIALIGPAGSGRSRFINEVLELEEEKLPHHPEKGERLPILIVHSGKRECFNSRKNCDVLYFNLDKRSDEKGESLECLNYEEARIRAISEQESAGWLVWFVDRELVKDANIVIPPAIHSVQFWLNTVMEYIIRYSDVKILFDPAFQDWFSRLLGDDTGDAYVIADTEDDSREKTFRLLNIKSGDFRKKFRELLEGGYSLEERNENIEKIDEILRKAQKLRAEIESSLSEVLTKKDVDRIAFGPIYERFDHYIKLILEDFDRLLSKFISRKNIKIELIRNLGEVLKSYVIEPGRFKLHAIDWIFLILAVVWFGLSMGFLLGEYGVFSFPFLGFYLFVLLVAFGIYKVYAGRSGERYLNLKESLVKDFDHKIEEFLEDLRKDFFREMKVYAEAALETIIPENIDKDTLRLEWPAIVLYAHLTEKPEDFRSSLGEISRSAQDLIENDTELGDLIQDFSERSIFDGAFNASKESILTGMQAEIEDIVNMFVFEPVRFTIAREKLYSYIFGAVDEFKENLNRVLESELRKLKMKYIARYSRSVGFRNYLVGPVLLQEALSKARMEMDDAIDGLSSVL